MLGNSGSQLPVGLESWEQKCRVVMRGGAGSKGDLVMFDIANSDAAVTTNQAGVAESGLSSVIAPVNAQANYAQYAVLLEDIADDQEGEALYRGAVNAACVRVVGTTNIAAGDPLTADDSGLRSDVVTGDKIIARAAEDITITTADTAVLGNVIFDGIYPIGVA